MDGNDELIRMADLQYRHHFYGVDGHLFMLDGVAYEAREDPSDGYRSYLDCIVAAPLLPDEHRIFFHRPLAKVRVERMRVPDLFEGYQLIDDDQHVWLKVGTNRSDDYYPSFTFDYTPPPGRLHVRLPAEDELWAAANAAIQLISPRPIRDG